METRVQLALENLIDDESLTAELRDAQAKRLLRWVRDRIEKLVAATANLEDQEAWTALEPQLHCLRGQLRQVVKRSANAADPDSMLRTLLASLDGDKIEALEALDG